MRISLTPELELAVTAKVQAGVFENASDLVCEAVKQFLARERGSDWLARESAIGSADLASGKTVCVDSREHFFSLIQSEI